jgi:hypothetical protein
MLWLGDWVGGAWVGLGRFGKGGLGLREEGEEVERREKELLSYSDDIRRKDRPARVRGCYPRAAAPRCIHPIVLEFTRT